MRRSASYDNISIGSPTNARHEIDSIQGELTRKLSKSDSVKKPGLNNYALRSELVGKKESSEESIYVKPVTPSAPQPSPLKLENMPGSFYLYQGHAPSAMPKFNPNNIKRWLREYEYISKSNGFTDQQKYNNLISCFHDTPYFNFFLKLFNEPGVNDWESVKRVLARRGIDSYTYDLNEIINRKQGPSETVAEYITRKEGEFGDLEYDLDEQVVIQWIIDGLRPEIYKQMIRKRDMIKSIEKLIQLASTAEGSNKLIEDKFGNSENKRTQRTEETIYKNLFDKVTKVSSAVNEIKRAMDTKNRPREANINQLRNAFYGEGGEPQKEKNNTPFSGRGRPPARGRGRGTPARCYGCNQIGHFRRDCPTNPYPNKERDQQTNPKNQEN